MNRTRSTRATGFALVAGLVSAFVPGVAAPALAASAVTTTLPLPKPVQASAAAAAVPAAPAPAVQETAPPVIPIAQTPGASAPASAEALAKVNAFFNSISTMSGDFVQFAPNGARSEGKFTIARPGRIRFQYDPPTKLQIVSDGTSVAVRNTRNNTQDIWPLDKTPLRFLLANNIDLRKDAKVTSVTAGDGLITVVVQESTVFGSGKLTLVFDENTAVLKQWTVTDAQNQDTSVAIYNVRTGTPVDPKSFKIDYQRILN